MGWEDQKKNEMGFLKIVKRFFEPVQKIQWVYIWTVLTMSNWFIIDFFIVFFADKIWWFVEENNIDAIRRYMIWFAIIFFVVYIVKYLTRKNGPEALKYTLAGKLWVDSFWSFFRMDISETEKIGTGKVMKIFSDGIDNTVEAHSTLAYLFTKLAFKLIIIGYILLKLWRTYILGYILLFTIIVRVTNLIFTKKVSYRRRLKREVWINNNRQYVRMIMSKIEILQNQRVGDEISKYVRWVLEQKRLTMINMKWVFLMFNVPLIVVHAFFGCILVYVFVTLIDWSFSYWTFVAMSIASGSLWWFMLEFTDDYKTLLDNFVEIEKLWEFVDTTPQMKNYDTGEKFDLREWWTIELENVWFTYSQWSKVFTDFSLTIEPGKKTALVGMSGSGKTTLMKLIAWYLMPDEGKVLVDGQDLATVALQSYFTNIGYLTQEPSVFDGTIRENLEYGMIEINKHNSEMLDQAVRLSKCDFINDLPNWLDTEIGERGIRLSGGQRQRLAIAKIFLKDPKIVLLDEPTSALDSFAEEAVTEAMENLFQGRTVVIIAHRLQTVKHADDIIVIDHGEVIERGTHDELVRKWWYYARMLELQSGF